MTKQASNNIEKTSPEAPSDANLAPRAYWAALGLDVGGILVPFWLPNSVQKRKKKQAELGSDFGGAQGTTSTPGKGSVELRPSPGEG